MEVLANDVTAKMESKSREWGEDTAPSVSPAPSGSGSGSGRLVLGARGNSNIKPVRASKIDSSENTFLKRRQMLRKRLSVIKVDEEVSRVARELVVSPLVDSTGNLTRALAALSASLVSTKKLNPALLLLMCELKGWIAPLKWNIRQCMAELDGNENIEKEDGEGASRESSRKLSFLRSENGFAGAEDRRNILPAPDKDAIAASLNKVTPIGKDDQEGDDKGGVGKGGHAKLEMHVRNDQANEEDLEQNSAVKVMTRCMCLVLCSSLCTLMF
jgi:hypothetical protein